jgi:hypothetical protein
MNPTDLRTLCIALGFTAVVMKGDEKHQDRARRALRFANLIEAFCTYNFPQPSYAVNENEALQLDEIIEKLKNDLRGKGHTDLQKDRETLLRLYDRLRQRYATFANDDMIADRVLELVDAELEHGNGAL